MLSNLLLTPSRSREPRLRSESPGPDHFILVTLHARYGSSPADRIGGLTAVAQWLADWGNTEHA